MSDKLLRELERKFLTVLSYNRTYNPLTKMYVLVQKWELVRVSDGEVVYTFGRKKPKDDFAKYIISKLTLGSPNE